MRKAVTFLLLVLFAIPVSGLTVKETTEFFFTDTTPDVVVGDSDNLDDGLAANVFLNEFGLKSATKASLASTSKVSIIIGGPCANSIWATLGKDACDTWDYHEGKAVIESVQQGDVTILLIGGTNGKDTRAAAKYVLDSFSDAIFNKVRVVIDTEGLELPKDQLKVYQEVGTVNTASGESSAKGDVIIEISDEASGGTEDLAEGLQDYLTESYPLAGIQIKTESEVSLNGLQDHIFVRMTDPAIIAVDFDAPSSHVVIAAAAAFWLAGQGIDVNGDMTIDQLVTSDLEIT